jgi:putative transposase
VLFLRKQLAFYQEHQISPRRLDPAARFSLVLWPRFFNWRGALMIVKPETLICWHRKGFKLWWRWKSRLGRPRIPDHLRQLIVRMVRENPTWGRGACCGGAVGEARDPGIAANGAGVLAARR